MGKIRRRHWVEIAIGGDQEIDVINALREILETYERKGVRGPITTGGVSLSWSLDYECDPDMTHDRYFELIEADREISSTS